MFPFSSNYPIEPEITEPPVML